MELITRALCRLFDIDPDEPEEIKTGYVSHQDLNSVLITTPDGSSYSGV